MEQKRIDKKNLLVIAILVLAIAVASVMAATQRREMADVQQDAAAYLVITVAGEPSDPIKLDHEALYPIDQGEKVNVVAVTKDGVMMHSATCDNQDCIKQGTVTLENRADRVLQNMIVCLPNEVVLELYTEEEVRAYYPDAWMDMEAADE